MAWVKFHSHEPVFAALIHLKLIINNGDTATTDRASVTGFIPGQIRFIKGIINKRGGFFGVFRISMASSAG
jgi:hypothetical protein